MLHPRHPHTIVVTGLVALTHMQAFRVGGARCDPQSASGNTVFVNGTHGNDTSGCGIRGSIPCRSIRFGIGQALDGGIVCVAMGTYTSLNGSDPYDPQLVVNKSLSVIADDGAVIDCSGRASGMDLLVSNGSHVELQGLTFHNCSGVNRTSEAATFGPARRPWGIGGTQDWCADVERNDQKGCSCALMFCSRAGGVSIIHQAYEQFDQWSQKPDVIAPLADVHVQFHKCVWTSNSAHLGGAVQLIMVVNYTNSSFTFDECRFEQNFLLRENGNPAQWSTFGHGSAFYQQLDVSYNWAEKQGRIPKLPSVGTALKNTSILFNDCHVSNNTNQVDGTISFSNTPGFWDDVRIEFNDTDILNNTVNGNGGGIEMYGGVPLYQQGPNNTIRINNGVLSQNKAGAVGGAALLGTFAYATLRTPQIEKPSNMFRDFNYKIIVEVVDTRLDSNEAFVGGAYATGNGYHIMRGAQFTNNKARQQAGALMNSLGGGDSGMEFHDCLFENNSAGHLSHTLFDAGAGPFFANSTTFKLHGTANGVEDMNLNAVGVAHVLKDTAFVCPNGYVLQNPTGPTAKAGGFTLGTTGVLQASWNLEGVGVSANFFILMCNKCPPGRYMLNIARLEGPFHSTVFGPGAEPNKTFGNISGQPSQNLDEACTPCPVGADCLGGNEVNAFRQMTFGYACNRDSVCSTDFPSDSIERRQVHFLKCPKGFCKSTGEPAWYATCLPHREGNLCGSCEPGFSEAWLGSFPCVRDDQCTSLPWLAPLLLVALFAFGLYIYISARKAMYTSLDAALLFFQMFPLLRGSSTFIDAVAPVVGLMGLTLDAGSNDDGGLIAEILCMAPGLTAYWKLYLGLVPPLLLPFIVFLVHCLVGRTLCLASLFDGQQVAIAPLTAAMLKTFFYCFSSVTRQLLKLSHCVRGAGQDQWQHMFAGDVSCEHMISFTILSVLCISLPFFLCTIAHLSKTASLFSNRPLSRRIRHAFTEIINREVASGIKPSMWWWAFALAMIRGVLALFTAVLIDTASQSFLSFFVCIVLFAFSLVFGPFENTAKNMHQSFLFFLLVVTSGFSIGAGVVAQAGSGIVDDDTSLKSFHAIGNIVLTTSLCGGGGSVVWAFLQDIERRRWTYLCLLRARACCHRCFKCRKHGQLLQDTLQDDQGHELPSTETVLTDSLQTMSARRGMAVAAGGVTTCALARCCCLLRWFSGHAS